MKCETKKCLQAGDNVRRSLRQLNNVTNEEKNICYKASPCGFFFREGTNMWR